MNKSRRPQAAEGQMPPATLDSAVKPRKTKLSLGPALLVPAGILLVYALFCVYKLFDLSINKHRYYTERAAYQHVRRQVQYPERGSILDSDGNILAGTTYIYTIGITPRDVRAIKGADCSGDMQSACKPPL